MARASCGCGLWVLPLLLGLGRVVLRVLARRWLRCRLRLGRLVDDLLVVGSGRLDTLGLGAR